MDDYTRIEAALGRLVRDADAQPSLAALAADAGWSPAHFQRVFTRWAGVSPKRFLQAVTVERARERLRRGRPVLEVALDVGLSGPGRLHDLALTCEAMTPGQLQRAGADVEIEIGTVDSPFGPARVAATAHGICAVDFVDDGTSDSLAGAWSRARVRTASDATRRRWQRELFDPWATPRGPLALHLRGTNFQIQVWRALLRLPPGAVTDYGTLADAVGRPGAARAVGRAVGTNPIAVLVPCHRVLRRDGAWGGYRWGRVRKLAILGREFARDDDQPRGRPDRSCQV